MRIDASRAWNAIMHAARQRCPVSEKMQHVISVCADELPHDDWARIAALPFDDDVERLRSWLSSLVDQAPPTLRLKGLWFGLFNPVLEESTAEMHFAGAETYDPNDEEFEWILAADYRPENGACSGSRCLRKIYAIAYGGPADGTGDLGNDAEWSLCLGFAVFSLQELLREQSPSSFRSDAERIGVAVGFDGGDLIRLGELTAGGLQLDAALRPPS